jgi:geranylgeranyl reductase family protein
MIARRALPTIRAFPMNTPTSCDVLVIGAGPAGSACAQQLARAGLDTLLVDQQAFPRDKVCGDGLIPDAHEALKVIGAYDTVMAAAQMAQHVGCIGPRGGRIDVPGRLAVLPRRVLDDILCRHAVQAGATLVAPARFEAPLLDGGHVVGARLKIGDDTHEVRARWLVLATGAQAAPLVAAGVCERRTPSGMALRGYVKNDAMVGRVKALEVVWHKRLKRGYGWIFPCPDGVFNIGVGLAHSHDEGRMQDVNLRQMFATFCEVYAPARELVAVGMPELKGAPLRCSLDGARWSRPGLLVAGEAAGSTYAFTGEGIGKALETGIHAARSILAQADDAAVRADYEAALAALKPRFDLYERAHRVNEHPWLADLLIWRANKSARILRRMENVLEEKGNPGNLVTARGLLRLFVPIK